MVPKRKLVNLTTKKIKTLVEMALKKKRQDSMVPMRRIANLLTKKKTTTAEIPLKKKSQDSLKMVQK